MIQETGIKGLDINGTACACFTVCFRFYGKWLLLNSGFTIFSFFLCVIFRYCCWSEINVMNIALSITSFQKTGAISFEISFFKRNWETRKCYLKVNVGCRRLSYFVIKFHNLRFLLYSFYF